MLYMVSVRATRSCKNTEVGNRGGSRQYGTEIGAGTQTKAQEWETHVASRIELKKTGGRSCEKPSLTNDKKLRVAIK